MPVFYDLHLKWRRHFPAQRAEALLYIVKNGKFKSCGEGHIFYNKHFISCFISLLNGSLH